VRKGQEVPKAPRDIKDGEGKKGTEYPSSRRR
jgi:hypothetical protein